MPDFLEDERALEEFGEACEVERIEAKEIGLENEFGKEDVVGIVLDQDDIRVEIGEEEFEESDFLNGHVTRDGRVDDLETGFGCESIVEPSFENFDVGVMLLDAPAEHRGIAQGEDARR